MSWDDDYDDSGDGEEGVEIAFFRIARETEQAHLFKLTAGILGSTVWIPKSISVVHADRLTVEVPRWFANQEDLEY